MERVGNVVILHSGIRVSDQKFYSPSKADTATKTCFGLKAAIFNEQTLERMRSGESSCFPLPIFCLLRQVHNDIRAM